MKSEKLHIKYDLNYILIAIRSQIEDYRLAYFLNKSSFFLLQRMSKDLSYLINDKTVYFSSFHDINQDLKREVFLIKNKTTYRSNLTTQLGLFSDSDITNTVFLIPELKDFDYFIKLVGIWKNSEILNLKNFITDIQVVESSVNIDLNQVKSSNNLVF
mgnify:FL=1|tara:strand:+ start:316 stop:789 length:474 start_codon:yes stop_codon:yes gene_type:complete